MSSSHKRHSSSKGSSSGKHRSSADKSAPGVPKAPKTFRKPKGRKINAHDDFEPVLKLFTFTYTEAPEFYKASQAVKDVNTCAVSALASGDKQIDPSMSFAFLTSLETMTLLLNKMIEFEAIPSVYKIYEYRRWSTLVTRLNTEAKELIDSGVVTYIQARTGQIESKYRVLLHSWTTEAWEAMEPKNNRVKWAKAEPVLDALIDAHSDGLDGEDRAAIVYAIRDNLVKGGYILLHWFVSLVNRFEDPTEFVKFMGEETKAARKFLLMDGFTNTQAERLAALRELAKWRTRRVSKILLQLVNTQEERTYIRVAAAVELGRMKKLTESFKARMVTLLVSELPDPETGRLESVENRFVREALCLALGCLRYTPAKAGLTKVFEEDFISDVRNAAKLALAMLEAGEAKTATPGETPSSIIASFKQDLSWAGEDADAGDSKGKKKNKKASKSKA